MIIGDPGTVTGESQQPPLDYEGAGAKEVGLALNTNHSYIPHVAALHTVQWNLPSSAHGNATIQEPLYSQQYRPRSSILTLCHLLRSKGVMGKILERDIPIAMVQTGSNQFRHLFPCKKPLILYQLIEINRLF